MKFLDTTFLIDHQNGEARAKSYLDQHESETFVTSTINIKKIAVGRVIVQTPSPSQQEIRNDFDWLRIEPFSLSHALEAAGIEADLREVGDYRQNLASDILVGGVAKTLNAPVVTQNATDFDLFSGVSTETY